MLTADNPFFAQVSLLVELLPRVAREHCFALKGGTAINLFVRDLPRLSVDIDLAYLPIGARASSLAEIAAALERIAADLESDAVQGLSVQRGRAEGQLSKLLVQRGRASVKVEVSPVLRGCVNEPHLRSPVPTVAQQFGYLEMPVMSFQDLYAGKLCAALDRQHPRDLFDVKLLLEHEGIDEELRRAFVVYLASHSRPIAELLAPKRKPIAEVFASQFAGMARVPVTPEDLEETRERLILTVGEGLSAAERRFLFSLKLGEPQWDLLTIPHIAELPAIQWKLLNVQKLKAESPARHARHVERRRAVLKI